VIALPGIGAVAIIYVVLGIVALLLVIIDVVLTIVQGLPYPVSLLAGPIRGLHQGLSHALGVAFAKTESLVGAAWHLLANYSERVWHSIETGQSINATAAKVAVRHATAINSLSAKWRAQRAQIEAIGPTTKQIEKQYKGIEAQIKKLEKEYHGIDEVGIRHKLNAINAELETLRKVTLPGLTTTADNAFADINTLEGWLGISIPRISTTTFASVVAVALGTLGLGGLRCNNFRNLLSKFGCGLGTLLNDLLGLMVSLIALEAVCEFLPLIEGAFGLVIGPMVHLLNEVPLGKCEQVPASWSQLNVAAGPVPPPQNLGTLPS
jgi:hypothetical protein